MAALLYTWVALAALLAMATGQTIVPTNWTNANADLQNDNKIGISVSQGNDMVPLGPILALKDKASNDILPTGLSGPLFNLVPATQLRLSPSNIALIDCDEIEGHIQAPSLLNFAAARNVTAVVLYSQTANYCDLRVYTDQYAWIYTTKGQGEADQLLGATQRSARSVYATIGPLVKVANGVSSNNGHNAEGSGGKPEKGNGDYNPLGPSPSTAVAMIILYSITGIITALFLVIIVTGAIRAHRHPERYGPRNVTGRPRQSRARGLARALLDTLPIVKFGEQEQPKPTDVELAENAANTQPTAERNAATANEANEESQGGEVEQSNQRRQSTEGGIAAAVDADRSASVTDKPNSQGCSICTEDFEAGQDQRVLPCDHRFHPDCVDPWLLNVSGTCPLCRIDLRPQTSSTGETGELDENGNPVLREGEFNPPPLDANAATGDRQRMSIRRSIIIGLMGVGRPDRMSREERVLWLRQLRGQQLARERRERQEGAAETTDEETSRRARLRSIFGVRTRRTGQAEGPARAASEAPNPNPRHTSTFGGSI